MEEAPIESRPCVNHEDKKIQNINKTISLVSDKKTFKIEFKNEIDILSVIAIYQDGLFPVHYTGKFTLKDIKKVGLFRDYESIDECLYEIFEGLDSAPAATEKDNANLIIKVPLHTRRYPEILFPLKKIDKSDSQKYEEMIDVLLNMRIENEKKDKEISELKEKVDKLEKVLQIKKETKTQSDENYDGTKIELFTISKEQYSDFFPDKSIFQEDICGIGSTIILECDENNINEVIETFNKYKSDIKKKLHIQEFVDFNIRSNKDKIFIDVITFNDIISDKEIHINKDFLFDKFIDEREPLQYLPFLTTGLKAELKTKATLMDLFEVEDEEKLDKIVYNTTLHLEGDLIKLQILWSFLILVNNNNKKYGNSKKIYSLVNDIFLTVINGSSSYTIKNRDMFYNYKEDIEELFGELKIIFFRGVSLFKDKKFSVFKKVNFNNIQVGLLGSPKYKVGYIGIKFSSTKNNEFIDNVLNNKIKDNDGKIEITSEENNESDDNEVNKNLEED